MTASRRYLPASLACILSLSAGGAAFAAGGSALDPYIDVPAPKALKGAPKADKNKRSKAHIPLLQQVQKVEKTTVEEDAAQSVTWVKEPTKKDSKHVKEAKPQVTQTPKKPKPVSTTVVSDVAPAPSPAVKENKDAKVKVSTGSAGGSDESVMSGIKAIGDGYSRTFKAASHGMVHSTKAASEAVLAGSKKMTTGIKSGAKVSGDVFKKGAAKVSFGLIKADDDKDTAAPAKAKVAKKPEVEKAAPVKSTPVVEQPAVQSVAKVEKQPEAKSKEGGLVSKMAHIPKVKMPKIGIPFMGGKKKPVVDTKAGATELGASEPETDVAAAPKKPAAKPAQTPIGEELSPREMAANTAPVPKVKVKAEKPKSPAHDIATNVPGGGPQKKWTKLWPFGHKQNAQVAGQSGPGAVKFQTPM
ncbi:MAG: hypothetical protein JSS86_09325 [Cyanobacteria bacterium SZAS LIN-2]|nr:hypothetical protein [Cyanobacteria bacterium SZAS LIN-3]MBS1996499.1 hypothetical protein [Cyanobacteria bacterium SZAS LIN-2]